MGKKRTRVPGQPRAVARAAVGDPTVQHAQTLVDDVREQRDVSVVTEKRQAARNKRRRLAPGEEAATPARSSADGAPADASGSQMAASGGIGSEVRLNDAAAKGPSGRVDARAAGLAMWKGAAERRKGRETGAAASKRVPEHRNDRDDDAEDADMGNETTSIDARTGAKILKQARLQRAELRAADATDEADAKDVDANAPPPPAAASTDDDEEEDEDALKHAADGSDGETAYGAFSTAGDEDRDLDFLDGSKITEEDELALSLFNKAAVSAPDVATPAGPRLMLADIIVSKIREKEEIDARAAEDAANPERAARDRKIAEVYGLVGNIMSRYRSGRVPKAFKVIPKMPNWQHLVHLTRPDDWSPASVYVATRLLASNLSAKEVIPFYTDILLPRCLDDIAENKKLNYHLYRALIKAVYKPDAFCKGIIFSMCEDECSLRQATIISSVVSKVSIPMLHSAAALLYLSQLPFSPTTSVMMTAIIEKKYALPYRVVDALVDSFVQMKKDDRAMPLMWHQCLLAFAQHYKTELTVEQKDKLKMLMRVHTHHAVTPEVRRELFSARNRGDLGDPDANTIALNVQNAGMVVD